jgi:NADH:ubiquinone oxidoreductase subunit F (NADH-binding)
VLDGAQIVARALRAVAVHVVVPGERPPVERAVGLALAERTDRTDVPMTLHTAERRFVAGESSAVLELIAGRPNVPITTSQPTAASGVDRRPTVLSNAETYAQLAMLVHLDADGYCALGTPAEPGTRLLTIDGDGPRPTVVEVAHGTRLEPLLAAADTDAAAGLLIGGYHGTWIGADRISALSVTTQSITAAGAAIGAGVLLPLRDGSCPVRRTAAVVAYLAGESANRCGPCRFGLPSLANAVRDLALGVVDRLSRIHQLMDAVEGRGACHHPDGTTRSVRSLLAVFPEEVGAHVAGACRAADRVSVW